jgi:type I restriction enzyme S subunit
MSHWPIVQIGEFLRKNEEWVVIDPEQTYKQVTARLWGKGLTLRCECQGSEIAASRQLRVHAGQFLVSRIDARNGAFGIVPDKLDGAVVSQDFPSFSVDKTQMVPKFLEWMSRTDWFVDLCKRASEGSTNRVRLKEDRFLAQPIPLFSIAEQQRIVAQLDGVAKQIEHRQRAVVGIGAELSAMLQGAFERIIYDAPRVRMVDVAPLVRRPIEVDLEGRYPEIGIRSFGKGTFHKPLLSGVDVGTKRLFEIHENDLIFNIVFAWEGAVAVAVAEDHGRVGSHRFLACVPDKHRTTAQFLRHYFLSPDGLKQLGEASPGGAGRNRTLGLKALEAIMVPCPSLDAQHWFDRLQAKARAAREAQVDASAGLASLIPALLDQEFACTMQALGHKG